MAHFTLLIFLELSNYSNYLNKNDFILRLSKSKNCKEYENEEKCVFQLISNKKSEFINFFGEIIINLPGFMTIYKDKFFARLVEFIDDKNYVNDLKNKCYDISLNYKYIDEFDEKYLGNKRKREKIDDDEMFRYDKEMKLLLNDYPKGKEGKEGKEGTIMIKKEKNILSSNDIENVKKRKLENNNINNNINNNNMNKEIYMKKKICEKSNSNSNDSVYINYFSETKKEKNKEIKNINNNDMKMKYDKNGKRIDRKKNKAESPRPFRYYSPVKSTYKDNLSLSLLKGKPKYVAVSDISSINNIISNENSFSIDELFISEISDISNKAASFGISSRFDRMPKINIQRKKRNLMNTSSGCLLGEIKEKLINKGLSTVCKQNINKLENEIRSEQTSLHNLVSNNFYGPENKVLKCENSSNILINKKEKESNEIIIPDKDNNNKNNNIINGNINHEIINNGNINSGKNKIEKKNNFVIENEIEFEMIEEKVPKEIKENENKKKTKTSKSKRNSIKKAKQSLKKNKSHKMILDENKNEKENEKSKNTKDDCFIPPSPPIEVKKNENSNIKLLNTLELHYMIKKNEISIKKVVEIPYIIIVQKIGLNLPEIQGFLSKRSNKESNLKMISEELTSSEREKTVMVEEDDENNNCVVIRNDEDTNAKEKKEKKRVRDRKSRRSGYKGGKVRDEEKKIKSHNIVKENGGEEVVENNKLTNISTIKSNWSNEEEAGNNLKSKNKLILQEKTYYEEDNMAENRKKNNYKNKNKDISNMEDNLTSVDVLNGFNYLYQQKSQ